MITREEIDKIFARINQIRDEVQTEADRCCDKDFYIKQVHSFLHQAEQTLLEANKYLGLYVLKNGIKDV